MKRLLMDLFEADILSAAGVQKWQDANDDESLGRLPAIKDATPWLNALMQEEN
jgi:hypothetical protein